jgi:tetratricopeptide (TPR) repeat protein
MTPIRILVVVFVSLLSFGMAHAAGAADPATAFDRANKLYEQGKFPEAAKAYDELIHSGHVSAPLHFNLGNAFLKAGEAGRAIVHYRIARRLAPRDPVIEANLRFARAAVKSGIEKATFWSAWNRIASLNELTLFTAALLWGWLAIQIAGLIQPARKETLRRIAVWCGTAAVLAGAWLAALWWEQIGSRPAVIAAKEAVVRFGPLDESQSAFTLHDGAEVHVRNSKNDWLEIETPGGQLGWIRRDQAVQLDSPGQSPSNSR